VVTGLPGNASMAAVGRGAARSGYCDVWLARAAVFRLILGELLLLGVSPVWRGPPFPPRSSPACVSSSPLAVLLITPVALALAAWQG